MHRLSIVIIVLFLFSCAGPTKPEDENQKFQIISEKVISQFPNGSPQVVEYREENPLGEQRTLVKEFWPSKKLKITGVVDSKGNRNGLWEAYFENGQKWSEGTYIHGEENGRKMVWYEDGKKRYEGEMRNGKPYGKWMFWDEKGQLTEKKY